MAYSREIEKLERQFAENPRRFAAPFADALRKSDEVERALEVIRVGLELNPDYIPGSVILGRCLLDLNDDNGAEAAFSRVLDLDNENVIALKSLADIMERQGRNDEAVSFLTYLLDVDRSNDEAREQLDRIRAIPSAPSPGAARAESSVAAEPPIFGAPPASEAEPAVLPPVEEFLEPTALWEPPVGVGEASLSSWVEPTAADVPVAPELSESLVEEPIEPGSVAPMDGLEASEFVSPPAGAAYEEFVLEREEEIILTSMSGAEYQVANDSEDLLGHSNSPPPAEPPPEPAVAAAEPVIEEPAFDAPAVREPVQDAIPVPVEETFEHPPEPAEPAPVSESAEETVAEDAGLMDAVADEAPFEWAMHVGEEREFHPAEATHSGVHAPDSFDDAIEGIAPVDESALTEDDAELDPEEGTAADAPVLMVTESMAELYAGQGHPTEALGVYRILYDRNPDNERLRIRIQELEAVLAAQVHENAEPSYAASVTGGNAVASFLGAMLTARPAKMDIPEPPPAPELPVAASTAGEDGEEAVASGAPTRPAVDRLSLGAIFGEDPSPVPPAENTAGAEPQSGAGGFSFDDFFGGAETSPSRRTSSGAVRATRATDDEDDLDQFHSWLQSLKR